MKETANGCAAFTYFEYLRTVSFHWLAFSDGTGAGM
jgi:hypothetical protein